MLIEEASHAQKKERVAYTQHIVLYAGNIPVQNNGPEVFDDNIHRIKQEVPLNLSGKTVYGIKYCGQICKKRKENVIQIFHVPEKYIQCRQDHSHSYIHNYKTHYGDDKHHESRVKAHSVNCNKHKIDYEYESEIDQSGNIL